MEHASGPIAYRVARAVLSKPLSLGYEIDVQHEDSLPPGPVILAANHRSFMDSIFLASVVERPISFLAKAEYFDRRRTAWMFRSTGQIPLRRGSPAGARQALAAARNILKGGGVVGVYPEGTRSRDGRLHRGRFGPARLAVSTGAPIVPVGLIGTEQVQPPDRRLPRVGGQVTIRFGSPRWIDAGEQDTHASLRRFTDLVMSDIARLCGQPYAESFATVG